MGRSYAGEGRITVLDDDSLSFDAEVELVLRGTRAQLVGLDELCVTVGSATMGQPAQAPGVVERVELDEAEWPVELSEANGFEARRSLRVHGTAEMSVDSAAHPCRAGEPVIRVGVALVGSEMTARRTACQVGLGDLAVELECPACGEPLTELGLEPTWVQPGDSQAAVLGSAIVVDAEGAVWRVGPASSGSRELLRTSPDDTTVEARVTEAPLDMRGRVALAGGSLPGVIRAHAFGPPYVPDEPLEPPPEGAGGGAGGEEPPPGDPMRSLRVGRADSGGERWARDFETYAYDIDRVMPVVAAAAGEVLVMVIGPRGLYVDGEYVAPKSSTEVHLVTLDEETGELLDFVEFEHPLFSAQGLSDGGYIASAGVLPGTFALLRLEADLAVTWLTPLPEESLEFLEMGEGLLSVDGAAGYWASPRGPLHRFDWAGEVAWRLEPPGQSTSMAIAPDGGLLVTSGTSYVAWFDPYGAIRARFDRNADASCGFELILATGGREPAYVRQLDRPEVGRLGAAP